MRFESAVLVASAIALLFAAPVLAQDSTVPEHLQGMVGDWRLEQEDQTLPICALKFSDEEAIGGWAIEVPEVCPAPYPPSDSLVAWNVDDSDGSVIILDAERNVVLRLFEDEDGLYDTDPAVQPRFYLLYPYDDDGSGGEAGDDVPD
ncbi:MAG: AprI/Inh family metalloprotease inhibitor [Devosia sp.]